MSTQDVGTVTIAVEAVDNASDALKGIYSELQQTGSLSDETSARFKDLRGEIRENASVARTMEQAWKDNHLTLIEGVKVMQDFGSVVAVGERMLTQYNVSQIRVEGATKNVKDAQIAYNDAVAKYGEHSAAATKAANELETAQKKLAEANQQNTLMLAGFALQIPGVMMHIINLGAHLSTLSGMISGAGGLTGALGSAGSSVMGFVGMLGPWGIALIAIAAAIGILYLAWTQDWGGIREILGPTLENIKNALGGFVTWLMGLGKTVTDALGGIGNWLKTNWQDLLIGALTGPVGLAYETWKNNWGGFRDIVSNAMKGVTDVLTGVDDWLKTNWKDILLVALTGPVGLVAEAWKQNWFGIRDTVSNALAGAGDAIRGAGDAIKGGMDSIGNTVSSAWKGVQDATDKSFHDVVDTLNSSGTAWGPPVASGMLGVHDAMNAGLALMKGDWSGAAMWFKVSLGDFGEAFAGLTKPVTDALDKVSATIKDQFPAIASVVDAGSEILKGHWQEGLSLLVKSLPGAFDEMKKIVGDALGNLGSMFGDFGKQASTAIAGFGDWLKANWKDILAVGLTGPVGVAFEAWNSNWGRFRDVVSKVLSDIEGIIKNAVDALVGAFKTAADTIGPVLKNLTDAIGGFIDWLKKTFQEFYDWLVGKSLWNDLWNAVLSTLNQAITTLLNALTSKFFGPMKDAFTSAADAVKSIWDKGWQAIQTTFTIVTTQIQSDLNMRFDQMKTFVTDNLGQYAPIANKALTAMQAVMNGVMDLIRGDWQGFLTNMQTALDAFWAAVQGATSAAFASLQATFSGGMNMIQSAVQGGFNAMQSAASSALSWIQNAVSSAWNAITSATSSLANTIVHHSIWPDMMNAMQTATSNTMANIVDTVIKSFQSVVSTAQSALTQLEAMRQQAASAAASIITSLGAPAAGYPAGASLDQMVAAAQKAAGLTPGEQYMTSAQMSAYGASLATSIQQAKFGTTGVFQGITNEMAAQLGVPYLSDEQMKTAGQAFGDAAFQQMYGRSPALGPATVAEMTKAGTLPQNVVVQNNIPITVQVDGATVAKTMEQRLIQQRQLQGGSYTAS